MMVIASEASKIPVRQFHSLRLQRALPATYADATPGMLESRIREAKRTLAGRLMVLGHHYQRDEVLAWADATGDSFGLSRIAASRDAELIVFCGVHFMAESADILTDHYQQVFLPDLNAGCSMADMADLDSVEQAWEELSDIVDIDGVVPITYMNSSADIKAFVGDHQGAVCTSTNAEAVLRWAFEQRRPSADKVLFVPDQHLGRNTGIQMGYSLDEMVVWDPRRPLGGNTPSAVAKASFLLWKGHCSVHQRFQPAHVASFRAEHPHGIVVVHPECSHEVVAQADVVGSTDRIIQAVNQAPPDSVIGVATEVHLVSRLANQNPTKTIVNLDPVVCPCSTMSRIDLPHLSWVLDELVEGRMSNRIVVTEPTATSARRALDAMLEIT
jgi:quinolinate synthase